MKSSAWVFYWCLVAFVLGALFFRTCGPNAPAPEPIIQRDTIVIRDTIRPPIPEPQVRTVVRYDAVRLPAKPVERSAATEPTTYPDTVAIVENTVVLPITEVEYKTDDYRAVVEGYNPRLVSIELYPQTTLINTTVTKYKRPKWAVTVGPGVGYGPKGVQPYVGVSVGFVIWSR